ncbi:hypothetical protein E2C01_033834 [Portunus trituberculatus]|uniref:Uncharacterized protein n=1 Tax=Portunus trituberculatus TaxID=210409 RepID=A0A5B7F547_PORTR|nr:hypothetical protein [Portunus trituberculatus]
MSGPEETSGPQRNVDMLAEGIEKEYCWTLKGEESEVPSWTNRKERRVYQKSHVDRKGCMRGREGKGRDGMDGAINNLSPNKRVRAEYMTSSPRGDYYPQLITPGTLSSPLPPSTLTPLSPRRLHPLLSLHSNPITSITSVTPHTVVIPLIQLHS